MDMIERLARAIATADEQNGAQPYNIVIVDKHSREALYDQACAALEVMQTDNLWLAARIEKVLAELPETISLDDVKHHEWLRRLVVAANDLNTRTEYPALEWSKIQP